jgi:hypothetical protein
VIDPVKFASLPTGVERRGFRGVVGNVQARAFAANVLQRAKGDLKGWVGSFGSGEVGWRTARKELEAVSGAGPWASFKWADLLKNVHGLPFDAPDIGVGGGSEKAGPVPGLVALSGKPWKECATDIALQRAVLEKGRKQGVPFGGLDQLETALCDFNSLLKGTYYVGHDIDLQMTALDGSGPGLWEARAVFPAAYRGERAKQPWSGVRVELKSAYAKRRELVNIWV